MIIECPQCRIHYEVGDTLPPEGMNVRCAECHEVWLAKPIDIDPPALQTNDNTTDISHDIETQPDATDTPDTTDAPDATDATDTPDTIPVSGTSETVTIENVDAKAGKSDLPAFPSTQFESAEIVDENNDIHRDQLFDEVHDEIYANDLNISADLDRQFEPAASNGLANGNLPSSIAANGHSLSADRLTSTSIGDEINKEIDSIAIDPAEMPTSMPASMPASKRRIPGIVFFSWITVFAAVAGVLLSAFMMPNRVARKFPVTVGFYDALGIDINSRGLVIQDVQYEHSQSDGRPALLLNGNVLNITDQPLKVPTVVAELRDKDGLILFVWATEVKVDSLGPNKTAPFSATIPAPTNLVRQVKLRFSTRP